MKNSKCLPNERRQIRDQLTRSCVFFSIKRASSTISAIVAREPRSNQWNMLMPVREYNKHIAKIPNCKMRQRPTLRATFASLLLLLLIAQTLDPAAASGSAGSGAAAAGAAGPAASGGAGGGSLSSGAPTLIANLTEQGSPGVYNSTMG
uniref:GM06547p n=1 Tax=Drosophila melanogaster TaxID=7227 RepID=Q95S78_DROME|nr:GM06547p [Drosophila melanogaster]